MSDPERLASAHSSALARSLLAAARDEEPASTLLAHTLARAGLAAGSGAAAALVAEQATAAANGSASAGAVTTASVAPAAGKLLGIGGLGAMVKWVGMATLAGGLATGAASHFDWLPRPQPVAPTSRAPRAAVTPSAPPARVPPGVVPPAPAAEPAAASASPSSPSLAPPKTPLASSIREESSLIDQIREAVAQGEGTRALSLLEKHRTRFPRPVFQPEALFLKMRAHASLGNERAARAVAKRLLDAYPNGPQAAAARALFETDAL
jgi:hypothetical protein